MGGETGEAEHVVGEVWVCEARLLEPGESGNSPAKPGVPYIPVPEMIE